MNKNLTCDAQKAFCKSYKAYTEFNDTDPFVMNLDVVLHDTGYSRRDKAKAAIIKLLKRDVTYIIKTEECS